MTSEHESTHKSKSNYSEIKSMLRSNYMLTTSAVEFATALANLKIIYWMNVTDGLDLGLGLAAIGIITFFGVSLSSSLFEEHRHEHGNKKKNNLIRL